MDKHSSADSQIYDPQRESQMLTDLQMANQGPFSNETINALFKEIFKATLNLEEKEARASFLVQRKSADQNTVIKMGCPNEVQQSSF